MILSCELQKMGQTPRSWWNCAKGICHVWTWIFFLQTHSIGQFLGLFIRLSLRLSTRESSRFINPVYRPSSTGRLRIFFSIRKKLIPAWYWVFKKSINLATWMTWSSFQLQAGYSIFNHLLIHKIFKTENNNNNNNNFSSKNTYNWVIIDRICKRWLSTNCFDA